MSPLSRREQEVVTLIGDRGLTYEEAAGVLRISVTALGARASRAYDKLGAGNIREALAAMRKRKKKQDWKPGEQVLLWS